MESLVIRRNRIVHLSLEVTDCDSGELIERTTDSDPHFVYLHGHGNLVTALEDTLAGLTAGAAFDVTVAEAYGKWHADALRQYASDALSLPPGCKVGDRVTANGPDGQIELTVSALDDDTVTLDANHPLAGRTLRYTGQVLNVTKAHKDEIRHHRPHPAGHHLMVQDSSFSDIMKPEDSA